MIHTVYTRMRYEDEQQLLSRVELARATTIPSMVAAAKRAEYQVRWAWFALERDHERIRSIVTGAGYPGEVITLDRGSEGYVPLYEEDNVQSTLDSDDKVAAYFLARVQRRWKPPVTPPQPYIVTWQPIKERFQDGALFNHRMRYAATKPSPFYSVYNPTEKVHVYAKSHGHMHELGAPVELVNERGAIAVIHGGNALMDIKSGDTPLSPPRGASSAARRSRRRRRGRGRRGDV